MDRQSFATQARLLRGIIARLNNSNPALPSHLVLTAQRAVSDLSFCRDILSVPDEQLKSSQSDAGVSVHSFRIKVTSLLQDRNPAARLAAVTLVKAAVHLGGYEVLNKSGAIWARALLGILSRPGQHSTKRLAIIGLVQIYRATQELPNLTREVTTPTLKDFIPACISLITTKNTQTSQQVPEIRSSLLPDVLQAFIQLVPHHPNVFRPFTKNLSEICGRIISLASDDSSALGSSLNYQVQALSQRFIAQLSRCAAKNASGEEWTRRIRSIKEHIINTADEVFRSIVETGNTGAANVRMVTQLQRKYSEQPAGHLDDELGLKKWVGLESGTDRLVSLLETLQAYIAVQGASSSSYTLPVDVVLSIVERLMSIFPGPKLEALATVAARSEFSREERELLFLRTERIQIAAIDTLKLLCQRLGSTAISISIGVLEHLVWSFGAKVSSERLRSAYYDAFSAMIKISGSGMSHKLVQNMHLVISVANDDVCVRLDSPDHASESASSARKNSADAYLPNLTRPKVTLGDGLAHQSAKKLLLTLLTHIPAEAIPNTLRARIDKSVVLVRDEDAMLASVLNITNAKPFTAAYYSIMPFLAREHPHSVHTEAVIRPRLPALTKKSKQHEDVEDEEEMKEPSHEHLASELRNQLVNEDDKNKSGPEEETMQIEPSAPVPSTITAADTLSPFLPPLPPIPSTEPSSPKRARPTDANEQPASAQPKRVKLATFEPAAGPTFVSVIDETTQPPRDGDESDSDGSSLPSIHMNDISDDDDEDEADD